MRFKRPFRRFITYANVTATLVLVFAMSGGALAAGHFLITSTKQISPKVIRQLKGSRGKRGLPGPTGPVGPQGAKGEQGPKGDPGPPGKNGVNGTSGVNGANGQSVTSTEVAEGEAACDGRGGSEFLAAEGKTTFACNGSPWTAGGTLPSEKSETGTWALQDTAGSSGELKIVSISFPIPLTGKTNEAYLVLSGEGEGESNENEAIFPSACKGTVSKPGAEPGHLCVFAAGFTSGVKLEEFATPNLEAFNIVGPTGGLMVLATTSAESFAMGTWAVTAE